MCRRIIKISDMNYRNNKPGSQHIITETSSNILPAVLKIFPGNASGGDNSGNSGSDNTPALPGSVSGHKDALDVCFKIVIRDKVRVEEFNLRCVQESGWVKNSGHNFIYFF